MVKKGNYNEITFIIPSLGQGGAERVVSNLANQMVIDGYNVNIYTIISDEEYYSIDQRVNHVHVMVQERNKVNRVFKRFLKLRSMVKNDNSSCVIAFDRYYGICCSLWTGKKIIGSERNDPYSNMPRYSIQKYFRDWLYKHVDCVVFQTEYARNYFSSKIQLHSVIIPNPVAEGILPIPHQGSRTKDIVAACRLTKQKNLPMMLTAFEIFSRDHPDYTLTIYGEGSLLEELQRSVDEKGMTNKVRFPGYIKNLPQVICKAAMYISTSDYEGISNSMLEALAMGLPTVCTDCPAGGAAMMIQHGINGYLTPVGDARAMADAMCKVVDDVAHTSYMCKEAVKIRDKYSVDKVAKMWESVIR